MTECNRLESWQQARGTQLRAFGAAPKLVTLKARPETMGALERTLKAEETDLQKVFSIFAGQGKCGRS